jgi:hypothetical protein
MYEVAKSCVHLIKIPMMVFCLFLALLGSYSISAQACTIFILTDNQQVLFCNNEDFSNTKTRIWFIPGGDGYYGIACVGFDDGYAQGGLNTEGLAYDVVAGYKEIWQVDSKLPIAKGNVAQRMLESCATVEDAIAFIQSYQISSFSNVKVLVADRFGASVIIGARDGKLQVEKSNQSRGFGYGGIALDSLLAKKPDATVANGFLMLKACEQRGEYGTKYSNVFDLKSNIIYLKTLSSLNNEVKLNMEEELKKGGHYYDIPQIHEQVSQSPQSLLLNMKRFPLDEFKQIPDKEPDVTARIRTNFQNAIDGIFRSEDYVDETWKEVLPAQKEIQASLKNLGGFMSLTLVDRKDMVGGLKSYRYRMEFKTITLLMHFVLNNQNKFVSSEVEYSELSPTGNDEVR